MPFCCSSGQHLHCHSNIMGLTAVEHAEFAVGVCLLSDQAAVRASLTVIVDVDFGFAESMGDYVNACVV